jgi:NADH:ubiquinone oxidoreductase subunit 2 (subunit N)
MWGQQADDVEQLAGLGGSHPMTAVALVVCLLSPTRILPLARFCGKLILFVSALGVAVADTGAGRQSWWVALAIAGAVNAAISTVTPCGLLPSCTSVERQCQNHAEHTRHGSPIGTPWLR